MIGYDVVFLQYRVGEKHRFQRATCTAGTPVQSSEGGVGSGNRAVLNQSQAGGRSCWFVLALLFRRLVRSNLRSAILSVPLGF